MSEPDFGSLSSILNTDFLHKKVKHPKGYDDFDQCFFIKYYGYSPSHEIYTNYRIKLAQIKWIDKGMKGEKIFAENNAPVIPKNKPKLTPQERIAFEKQIAELVNTKSGGKPIIKPMAL